MVSIEIAVDVRLQGQGGALGASKGTPVYLSRTRLYACLAHSPM